jgi:hypothetical protein
MKAYSLFAFILLAAAFSAEAAPSKRILISVGDLKDNQNKEWKKATCLQVYNLANQIADSGADITCREYNTDYMIDKKVSELSPSYDYHLRILRSKDDELKVDVTNWHRTSDSDFKNLGWNFKDNNKSKISKADAFTKFIGNFFLYAANEKSYKAGLLINGAFESTQIDFDKKTGYFVDRATNQPISIDTAISLYENESPRKKNYLRTGIEIGVQLSAAMAIYYKNLAFNAVDFDYTLIGGLKAKYITHEAWKFDDNDKISNYGHTYAGVMYYQTARSNGFNSLESALITFASSAVWETLEYHEVFSLNDMVLTPVGGYVIGEATYQISCALLAKNSLIAKTLGYTINPNMGINHALDKKYKGDKFSAQKDCKKPRFSDISVYVGLENRQKSYEAGKNSDYNVGMNATVVNIENYNKEGKERKMVYDSAMTKVQAGINGNDILTDMKVVAQVVMAAYHQKNLTLDEKGQLRGYDIILGLGSGSSMNDRGAAENDPNEDFYGTVNILGATAHATGLYKGYKIEADFGVYGDFAMVKSFSLEEYKANRGGSLADESSIVKRKGYYWGTGSSLMSSISASKGIVEVGYETQYSRASSIDKRNRIESKTGTEFSDTIHLNKVYANFKITKNLKFQIAQEYNVRTGKVNNGLNKSGVEKRVSGKLIYQF